MAPRKALALALPAAALAAAPLFVTPGGAFRSLCVVRVLEGQHAHDADETI